VGLVPEPERGESAIHWALRLFGFIRPKEPLPPPKVLAIALYALIAVVGLVLTLLGYALGLPLFVPCGVLALKSWWVRHRALRADPR
jgi:hypothetical protein